MKIDLTTMIYNNLYKLPIEGMVNVPLEYLENTDIREISLVKVSGYITYNQEVYELNINVKGHMILPCARTLKDVKYPFDIDILEEIGENNDNSLEIIQNRLEIFPIIWQNILVDVPLRVLHPDAEAIEKQGDGWRLITEDNKKEEIDPRLEALSKFIKE